MIRSAEQRLLALATCALGLAFTAGVVPSRCAAEEPPPAPLFRALEPNKHLGDLRQNETFTYAVPLQNLSDRALTIVQSASSCISCLQLKERVALGPKETRDAEIVLRTLLREGPLHSRITLAAAEAPTAPGVELLVDATILPEFTCAPGELDLGAVRARSEAHGRLEIKPLDLADARVLGVSVRPGVVDVDAPGADKPGPWALSVRPKDPDCQGEYEGVIAIRTNSSRCPELRVPVRYRVDAGYALDPPYASMGMREYETAAEAEATIALRRTDGRAFSLGGIEPSAPYVTARCDDAGTMKAEHLLRVGLTLTMGRPPSNTMLTDSVLVRDDSGQPAVRIRVRGLLQSAVGCCTAASPEALARERAALEKGVPPYFRTDDSDGHAFDVASLIGKPALLVFFCGSPACQALAAGLTREERAPFTLCGLLHWSATDTRGFLKQTGFPGALLIDTGAQIGDRFAVPACPYVVVLNAQGRIVHRRLVYKESARSVLQGARKALEGGQ